MNNRNWRGVIAWAVFAAVICYIFFTYKSINTDQEISYSEFKRLLGNDQVRTVVLRPDVLHGRFQDKDGKFVSYHTIAVNDPNLVDELDKRKVDYRGETDRNWFQALLMNFGPAL